MCPDTYVKYIRFNVFMVWICEQVEQRKREARGKETSSRGKIAQHKYTLNGVTAV